MKKIILILILFCGLVINTKAQKIPITRELSSTIRTAFITEWEYFRMLRNPLIQDEEKYDGRSRKRPSKVIPILDTFHTNWYEPDIKIYQWESVYKQHKDSNPLVNPFLFIIEKKDGITGIRREKWTNKILDTLRLNVYDSIFPYDNRFLVYYNEYEDARKCIFYSGNVDWIEKIGNMSDIGSVGDIRGVQFGVGYVKTLEHGMTDSLRKLRPEYPDYVYATADESFISRGKILIAGHENNLSDYIEFIFYSDDSTKTGDSKGAYYEMRYLLPTNIKSIKERRMEKRKLSAEEQKQFFSSYLKNFRDISKEMWLKEIQEGLKALEAEETEE
jgi:hypothetical protein